jgi:hypothetical protein
LKSYSSAFESLRLGLKFISPSQIIQLSARPPPAHFNPMTQPATPLLSEPGQTRVLKVICILVCVLSAGCGRHEPQPNNSSATNLTQQEMEDRARIQSANWQSPTNTDPLAEAMRYADKMGQEKLRNPPAKTVPLPNYQAGPLNPRPIHVNFYAIDDRYPTYLQCQYDNVDEQNYDQSKEEKRFKASLEQIRRLGPKKFPPIKWVAVIIVNRAEWKEGTIDQAHKVGAIFKASDVFDSSRDLSQLVAEANMDRHPFKYDTSQPTPGEQQRWVIVERHAATNLPTTGSN